MSTATSVAPAQTKPEGLRVQRLPLEHIEADPNQPRRHFDEAALQELAASIAAHGLLQPITVDGFGGEQAHYRIIAGERRFRASQLAGLTHIDAIVRMDLTDAQVAVFQVLENLQRADLTTPELVRGVEELARTTPLQQLADQLGKDKAWVSRYSTVHKLWQPARALVMDGLCSVDLAHDLAQLQDVDSKRAQQLAEQIRTPPQYRGPITRDDVRSHLQMAKQNATEAAKQKDAQLQREVNADNQRGHETTAGEDRDATRNRELTEAEAQDELAQRAADAQAKTNADNERAAQQRYSTLLEITDALERRIEHSLGIERDETEHGEIEYRDAKGKVFADFPVEVCDDETEAVGDAIGDARYAVTLRLALTREQVAALAAPLGAIYTGAAAPAPVKTAEVEESDLQTALRAWLRTAVIQSPTDRIKSSWLWEQFKSAVPAHADCCNPDFGKAMKLLGYQTHRLTSGVHYLGISPAGAQA